MNAGSPVRFTYGISTDPKTACLGDYPLPNPVDEATGFWDFFQYVAADWTVTNTTSHATIGLVAASSTIPAGGVLGLVGGASSVSTDVAAIQVNPLNFYVADNTKAFWFECHLNAANASNEQLIVGIASSLATLAPTDGIYFAKAAGAATIDFVVRAASTSTTASAVTTLVAATNTKLGFYYDGRGGDIKVYVNDAIVARQTVLTNLPTATALGAGLAIKLSATAPTTAAYYTDFILAAQDRSY